MVKLTSTSVFRPILTSNPALLAGLLRAPRCYATHQSPGAQARRKAVTPFNDDGNVPWTELSRGEKTARAAQQTFNFGMVIFGVVLTVRNSELYLSLYPSACAI
jgi:import inner membrane translocase subunit TIM21